MTAVRRLPSRELRGLLLGLVVLFVVVVLDSVAGGRNVPVTATLLAPLLASAVAGPLVVGPLALATTAIALALALRDDLPAVELVSRVLLVGVAGLFSVAVAVTRTRHEQELQRIDRVAALEARASEESSRRFLADAAHQLRTPLAGIRACAELLLRGASEADRDRLLAMMVRETSRSARLITALLQIARLDQGQRLPSGQVDVVAICRDEVDRLSLLAPELDVGLAVQSAPPGPLPVDAGSCHEIISNLGDNARRHARSTITFSVAAEGEEVLVSVTDDGPGVPEEARERVFERFVSLDNRGGSGLGLAIARGLARAMGGDVRYADGFVLTLPLGTAAEPSA